MKEEAARLKTELECLKYDNDDLRKQNQRLQAALLEAEGGLAVAHEELEKLGKDFQEAKRALDDATGKLRALEDKTGKQINELQNMDEVISAPMAFALLYCSSPWASRHVPDNIPINAGDAAAALRPAAVASLGRRAAGRA